MELQVLMIGDHSIPTIVSHDIHIVHKYKMLPLLNSNYVPTISHVVLLWCSMPVLIHHYSKFQVFPMSPSWILNTKILTVRISVAGLGSGQIAFYTVHSVLLATLRRYGSMSLQWNHSGWSTRLWSMQHVSLYTSNMYLHASHAHTHIPQTQNPSKKWTAICNYTIL